MNETNYQWTARVKDSGGNSSLSYVRQHQFPIKDAVSFDNEDSGISALEYVIGAIGGDLIASLKRVAKKKRVNIDMIETVVMGELENPLIFLQVVGEEGTSAIKKIHLKVYISSLDTPEEIELVWTEALRISPLINTFKTNVKFEFELKIIY